VLLTATFERNKAAGTWSLREKASGSELASGSYSVGKGGAIE
jgi:hypothetical protein